MKKIRIEQGKLIAYIEQSDVEVLAKTKDVVPKAFFEEESVRKGFCDDNGFYRIGNLECVNYIKSAAFIPNQDYLGKLEPTQLERLSEKAIADHRKLAKILQKLYGRDHLTEGERTILEENQQLKASFVSEVQELAHASNDEQKEIRFIVLEECLKMQSEHYANSIYEYVEQKKQERMEKAGMEKKGKTFSLKRIFKRK